jgi:hypothetical protein
MTGFTPDCPLALHPAPAGREAVKPAGPGDAPSLRQPAYAIEKMAKGANARKFPGQGKCVALSLAISQPGIVALDCCSEFPPG